MYTCSSHAHSIYLLIGDFQDSQFFLNCTNLSQNELESINVARGVSGFVCAMISIIMICLLLFYKSYKSVLQRLFLVFTVDTVILEILLGLQIEHRFKYQGQDQFCTALGFLIQWTGSMTYTYSLGIVIVLAVTVYQRIRGYSISETVWKRIAEFTIILVAFLTPLLYIWPPFINGDYGLETAYCWIRQTDKECNRVDLSDQLQFFIISQTIELVCVFVTIVLTVLYCVLRCKYKGVGTYQVMTLLGQTLILMTFLVCHWVINCIAIAVHAIIDESYVLWLTTDAVSIPLLYLLVPFGFLVHLYAVRHTGLVKCCTCTPNCCRRYFQRIGREDYTPDYSETRPTSHPINARSDTYWSVPYTNEFTSVVAIVSSGEENNEQQTLVPCTSDTGYGSHAKMT